MAIVREHYTFTDLVKKKIFAQNDLIHLGQTGNLPFYVIPSAAYEGHWATLDTCDPNSFDQYDVYNYTPLELSPHRITPLQFLKILDGQALDILFQKNDIEKGMDESGLRFSINEGIPVRYFSFNTPVFFNKNDLVAITTDLEVLTEETAKPIYTNKDPAILDGREQIESILGWSWNYCKDYMKEEGIHGPPEGERKWKLPLEIAQKIRRKHPHKKKK